MANKITIKFPSATSANAFGLWVESEQMLEDFNASKYAQDLSKATDEELNSSGIEWDSSDDDVHHTVEVE